MIKSNPTWYEVKGEVRELPTELSRWRGTYLLVARSTSHATQKAYALLREHHEFTSVPSASALVCSVQRLNSRRIREVGLDKVTNDVIVV